MRKHFIRRSLHDFRWHEHFENDDILLIGVSSLQSSSILYQAEPITTIYDQRDQFCNILRAGMISITVFGSPEKGWKICTRVKTTKWTFRGYCDQKYSIYFPWSFICVVLNRGIVHVRVYKSNELGRHVFVNSVSRFLSSDFLFWIFCFEDLSKWFRYHSP